MKIIECYIENFGKLSAKKFDFSDGFNTLLAENGYGKTTLSVFIKCMLYGMSDTKKMSLDENERKRYLPWSGAACSGSMTFKVGDKLYRVERIFAPKAADDRFKLYNLTLGRESEDYSENLGEELFGVDAESFERTLFLSEKNLSPKNDSKSISAKLSELVGCDGDISSMDGALKLLEEQRKAYAKKGGSGEIADTRLEISRIAEEIAAADRCEERMKEAEERLKALVVREMELRDEDKGIIREREVLAKRNSEMAYKSALTDMQTRLSVAEARRAELIDFFRGEVPSAAAIDRAKLAESEAKRLRAEASATEDSEFVRLREYFANKTSPERIAEIREILERARRDVYEESPVVRRKRDIFVKRVPSLEEIEAEISDQNKEIKPKSALFIIGGVVIALSIALGILVSPLLLLLSLVGIAVCALAPIIKSNEEKKKRERISKFFASVSDALSLDSRAPISVLHELRALLTSNEGAGDERGEEDKAELLHFAFLFGRGESLFSDVADILAKYERYKELLAIEKYKAQNRARAELELAEREAEVSRFLQGFKASSADPIEEVRAALSEYVRLSDDIVAKRRDLENLSSGHKTAEDSVERIRSADELDRRGIELSHLLSDVSRERALLDRQYRADAELLEAREELISKKDELEERLEKYTENLEIIKLTKKYLETARDNMTVKYLGKTKSGFDSYTKRISGDEGGFSMDTDFSVSKIEGAKTHATEAYSRGMRDLYNLAVRFALIDSLYENEEPFVILDDPFIAFDDEKSEKALEILREFAKERQIIYFTCSKSRT